MTGRRRRARAGRVAPLADAAALAFLILVLHAGCTRDEPVRAPPKPPGPAPTAPAHTIAPPPPARSGGTAAGPLFPYVHASASFVFATDAELELQRLAEVAEDTRTRFRAWLDLPPAGESARPVEFFLCQKVATILELERSHGLPTSDVPGRSFAFRGGCYAAQSMVAIPVNRGSDMRSEVVHEVAHLVFDERVGFGADTLDEGLATLAPAWILPCDAATPEDLPFDARRLPIDSIAHFLGTSTPLSLRRFLELGYWEFRDERVGFRNYDLAAELVRFLLQSDDPAIRGRFRTLLGECARTRSAWSAFRRVYDAGHVERAWRTHLAELARPGWGAVWGDWHHTSDGLRGSIVGDGSAAALRSTPPVKSAPWSIGFRLPAEPPEGVTLGFVLAFRSPTDFVYAEVCGGRWKELAILERQGDRWARTSQYALPRGVTFRDACIVLDCDAGGRLVLSVDGRTVAAHEFGPRAFEGRTGLMLAQNGASWNVASGVEFREVVVR